MRLQFWRRPVGAAVHHRNPLFDEELGVTPSCMLGDILHSLYLGVFHHYCAHLFAALNRANVFQAPAPLT